MIGGHLGMGQISSDEIRPIIEVIDNFSFLIEDTRKYEPYKNGGFVVGVNFSNEFKYKSFGKFFDFP